MDKTQIQKNGDLEVMRNTLLKLVKKRYKPKLSDTIEYWIKEIICFILILVAIPFLFVYEIIALIFGGLRTLIVRKR